MKRVGSWGNLEFDLHEVVTPSQPTDLIKAISSRKHLGLAYGMGRSYGDVCLNANGTLWSMRKLDHFISFDTKTGKIICETGVLLGEIQSLALRHGWMLPVSPGTQFVTLGGAIANDIHGKNHYSFGTFGHHITKIKLARTDGEISYCSREKNQELFTATIGGLGLTGVITEAEIQLRAVSGAWLEVETIAFTSLNEFFELANESEATWEHTVAWIDCLSGSDCRGIFMKANQADKLDKIRPATKQKNLVITPPFSLVNFLSLSAFNSAYFNIKKRRSGTHYMHYEDFFYPLDGLKNWNRIYGPRGFYQFQCVIPREDSHVSIALLLEAIKLSGQGSFLSVLKTFGSMPPAGLLSFPTAGVTLAVDFANKGHETTKLLDKLYLIVKEAGGRIYPAKDARMPSTLFSESYKQLEKFIKYRDPGISSGLSRRILGV